MQFTKVVTGCVVGHIWVIKVCFLFRSQIKALSVSLSPPAVQVGEGSVGTCLLKLPCRQVDITIQGRLCVHADFTTTASLPPTHFRFISISSISMSLPRRKTHAIALSCALSAFQSLQAPSTSRHFAGVPSRLYMTHFAILAFHFASEEVAGAGRVTTGCLNGWGGLQSLRITRPIVWLLARRF